MNRRDFFKRTAGTIIAAPIVANIPKPPVIDSLTMPIRAGASWGKVLTATLYDAVTGRTYAEVVLADDAIGIEFKDDRAVLRNLKEIVFPPVHEAAHVTNFSLNGDGESLLAVNLTEPRHLMPGDTISFPPDSVLLSML